MKINGIIAEYNPFHNGHLYQLEESKRLTDADYTIVVMSGNFVQRGTPSLLDKHARAEMALRCGADLVLELPTLYATASAEYFAMGGVTLLDKLGVVKHLCFGSECGDTDILQEIATILSNEPKEYSVTLKEFLARGYSYPTARNMALLHHYPHLEQYADALSSPNNILGIEYCKALLARNSTMEPLTVKRADDGYHSEKIRGTMCSATAIRKVLSEGNCSKSNNTNVSKNITNLQHSHVQAQNLLTIENHLPRHTFQILSQRLEESKTLHANDISVLLYYKLLCEQENGFAKYLDVSPELSDRIRNNLHAFIDFESFCNMLKTKEITHTRISRCLLHILLNITKADMEFGKSLDYIPYARVLGFRKESTELLGAIKEHSSIPLITKLADAENVLDEDAYALLKKDIWVSEVYQGIIREKLRNTGHANNETSRSAGMFKSSGRKAAPYNKNEFTTPIVIV